MFEKRLRTWHRRLGIAVAPFLLIQTLSGFLFSADLSRDLRTTLDLSLSGRAGARELSTFERIMATIHMGHGAVEYAFHVLLSVLIYLLAATGVWVWFRRVKRR